MSGDVVLAADFAENHLCFLAEWNVAVIKHKCLSLCQNFHAPEQPGG